MTIQCTRCDGSGFINLEQLDDGLIQQYENAPDPIDYMLDLIERVCEHPDYEVSVCDCCGDGEEWYGAPGWHYGDDDPKGADGPYAYNGGLCECH